MRMVNICLSCLGCLLGACLGAQEENPNTPLSTLSESEVLYFQMLVEGNNRFAFDLYQHMKSQPGNLYFSSYSIVTGLGMVAIGVKGETAHQFQHAFRYSLPLLLFIGDLNESLQKTSDSRKTVQIFLANALWLDKSVSVLPSFKQTFMRNFRAILQPIDFASNLSQSIKKINQWVSQQTEGKLSSMVSAQDIAINMRMILTTAAYLKGQWAYPFDRKLTKRLPFQITAQRTFLVDMMQNTSNYLLWKGEKWDVLVVPYEQRGQGAQFAMAILLPKKEVPLTDLEKDLTLENWRQWKSQLQNQVVALTLPSFRIDEHFDLETILKRLGFNSVFTPEANFSGMTTEKRIYLNAVIHKTSIRVDEKGTDTRAVGIKPAESAAGSGTPYEFIADRPFVFIIWDQKTDSILFMGRLAIP